MAADKEFLTRVKTLVIIALFSDDDLMDRLVLKGGNLLDIVLGISARASVDVDFSIDGEFDNDNWLLSKVSRVLTKTFSEQGYVVFDVKVAPVPPRLSAELEDFWGGYRVEFKTIEKAKYERFKADVDSLRRNAAVIGKRDSTKFKIDISKHEYCGAKQAYSLEDYTIFAYPPGMAVCEKLRAICQQMPEYVAVVRSHPSARARDFVDIWTLVESCGIDFTDQSFGDMLRRTFDVKRVSLSLLGRIVEFREYHAADFPAVQDTIKPEFDLKPFDFYFDYVAAKCNQLESLWNK